MYAIKNAKNPCTVQVKRHSKSTFNKFMFMCKVAPDKASFFNSKYVSYFGMKMYVVVLIRSACEVFLTSTNNICLVQK